MKNKKQTEKVSIKKILLKKQSIKKSKSEMINPKDNSNQQKIIFKKDKKQKISLKGVILNKNAQLIKRRVNDHKRVIVDDHKIHSLMTNKHIYKNLKSIQYSDLRPFWNLKKQFKLFEYNLTLGIDGCTCESVEKCPWKIKWTKGYNEKSQRAYFSLLSDVKNRHQDSDIQIEKDLKRTHSNCKAFQTQQFQTMLKNILTAYSIYDTELRYIQGFNNIAGVYLYHIKEAGPTFWALVQLLEERQFRQIYLNGFKKLNQHCKMLQNLLIICFEDVKLHLVHIGLIQQNLDVDLNSVLYGWFLSMMSTCIPLEYMHLVLDGFKQEGWEFFYRIIITYFAYKKEALLQSVDQTQCLMALSSNRNNSIGIDWIEIIQAAHKLSIQNSQVIQNLKI